MTEHIKEPHTALFIGQTNCGKTHLVLQLIENHYNKHFDDTVITCRTLRENYNYHAKEWMHADEKFLLVDPKKNLYQWIKKLSEMLRFLEVIFIIDDIIANKDLDKKRQPLLELTISGRHRGQYLWLHTQSYKGIPKKSKEQAKGIFVRYPKERIDQKMIHDEKARHFSKSLNMHPCT